MEYTIKLTKEEIDELKRTLTKRVLFDIKDLQKEAADKYEYEKIAQLQKMLEINEAILNKLNNL